MVPILAPSGTRCLAHHQMTRLIAIRRAPGQRPRWHRDQFGVSWYQAPGYEVSRLNATRRLWGACCAADPRIGGYYYSGEHGPLRFYPPRTGSNASIHLDAAGGFPTQ